MAGKKNELLELTLKAERECGHKQGIIDGLEREVRGLQGEVKDLRREVDQLKQQVEGARGSGCDGGARGTKRSTADANLDKDLVIRGSYTKLDPKFSVMPPQDKEDFEKAVNMIRKAYSEAAPGSVIKSLDKGGSHIWQLRTAVKAGIFDSEHTEWAVTYFGGELDSEKPQDKTKKFHKMTSLFNNGVNKGAWGDWV